jgi:murein DD-endopeptidase MepM/ murein hydrolase activator NlpD
MAAGSLAKRGLMGGKGMVIQLDHGGGLVSRYCHLQSFVEFFGDVQEGQFIAHSGASGFVTGPHLHWEVLRDGVYIDPVSLFQPPETPLQLIDGLWDAATVLEGLEHDPEANEIRRIVIALKPHLGL